MVKAWHLHGGGFVRMTRGSSLLVACGLEAVRGGGGGWRDFPSSIVKCSLGLLLLTVNECTLVT
jgi:hypothetical protein